MKHHLWDAQTVRKVPRLEVAHGGDRYSAAFEGKSVHESPEFEDLGSFQMQNASIARDIA